MGSPKMFPYYKLEKAANICVLRSKNGKKQTTPLMRTKPCWEEGWAKVLSWVLLPIALIGTTQSCLQRIIVSSIICRTLLKSGKLLIKGSLKNQYDGEASHWKGSPLLSGCEMSEPNISFINWYKIINRYKNNIDIWNGKSYRSLNIRYIQFFMTSRDFCPNSGFPFS